MKTRIVTGTMLTLLLTGMLTLAFNIQPVMVVGATPWDGVPDDPTPAQAMWVDPKNTPSLHVGDVFTVDILVNITSPTMPGGGTGLYGPRYKLFWNLTVLEAVEIQTHFDNVPSGDLPPGWTSVFIVNNTTGVWMGGPKDGWGFHSYALSALPPSIPFTGVASVCTFEFKVLWEPKESEPDFCGLLEIHDDHFTDARAHMGQPLEGLCKVCPNFMISKSE